MNIKTWSQRITPESTAVAQLRAMQAEIDELRAALQERDAAYMDGYECGKQEARDAAHTEIDALRATLEQALEALLHAPWKNWRTDKAITAIQEQLHEHN